jgi:PAS domain S-box-containing protein
MSKPRKSGIDILGDLPWGSHLCLFYETKQDLLDALLPFFKAGLENNEFIIWVIPDPGLDSVEEAKAILQQAVPGFRRLLEKGQIEILHAPDWYLREEEFNMEKIVKAWNDKLRGALARGYDGMRASGDLFWLGQKYWKDFYAYEKCLHDFIAGLPAIILCTYPLPKFGGAEVLDIVQAHQFGIGRRHGKWELIESPELIRAGGAIKAVTGELQEGRRQPPELRVMHYLAAVLSVVVTLILARTMAETLGVTAPVSLLLCAIMFSAWYGGVRPGLLALVLTLIAYKFYMAGPVHSWKIDARELPRFVVFALSSLLVVLLIGAQKTATGSLRRALAVLGSTIRKLRETNGALRLQVMERKQAEDQLRLAYQRLSYHVENTPLAVIEFDKDLTITRWSDRAEEIFGWKVSEALGKNVYDPDFQIVHEEDRKAVDKINEELTKGTVNRNLSLNRNYTRNGQVIDCEWHNSVLRDEQGNVITIMSLVHDVTERKKTEQNLNRSYEEVRQLTSHLQNIREEERSHIAREIHDELGQQLTVLKMDVLGLSKKLGDSDAVIQQKIRDITDLLDTTVRSVRRISSELRPSLLYNLGLDAAIEWHLKEFGKRSDLKTIFIEPAEEVKIPDPVKNGLFRIFQESLTNVGRHANATKVIVSLEQRNGQLTLTIEDDGQGFEQERIGAKQTLGIVGMRERCEMMGGNYAIRSAPGEGTIVAVTVPYDNKNKPQ